VKAFELTVPRSTLRYHDLPGNGTPIVFLHGLGCASSCDYPRIAADPALTGRRMLLVDLLGSGFSDRPEDFGYTIDDHAGTVLELLRGLSLPAVDLVGHSMGGTIAIVAAAKNPGAVRRLIVSEPNLDPGGGTFSRPIAQRSEVEYVNGGHANAVRSARMAGQTIWASTLALSLPVAMHRASVSLVRGSQPSWRQQLASLPHPRTVLFGAQSLPDPDTEQLPRSGVAVRIVPDAGHSLIWENPSEYARAIGEAVG
jgi:pimeloyl-ACP methyl ester carboxylesterase